MQAPFDGAGTYVTEGTTPAGSQWSRCPIPRNDMHQTGRGFAPPCMQFGMPAAMCQGMEDGQGGAEPTLEIVDRVLIPEGTPPGECECSHGRGAGDLGLDPPTVVRRCSWLALVRPCPHCLLRLLLVQVLLHSASHCCETQKERFAGHQGLRGEQPDLAYVQGLFFVARRSFVKILTEELCCCRKLQRRHYQGLRAVQPRSRLRGRVVKMKLHCSLRDHAHAHGFEKYYCI